MPSTTTAKFFIGSSADEGSKPAGSSAASPRPTRERWLLLAVERLRSLFVANGASVPQKIRVSCGWPGGRKRRVVGECWVPDASADHTAEVFISPEIADPPEVLAILVHELVHAAVHPAPGHRGAFKRLALKVGLEGKMTSTVAGPALTQKLAAILRSLPPYPHAVLSRGEGAEQPPKQETRMIKVACAACEYILRGSRKALEFWVPTCKCGKRMEVGR